MVQIIPVGPSETPVVSLAEAKAFMRVDTAASDAMITQIISAVTAYFDGEDGIMGRALRPQVWRLETSAFPLAAGGIEIPLPPTISIDSVRYIDAAGDEITMSTDDYRFVFGGNAPSWLFPAVDTDWPAIVSDPVRPDAVRVVFTAGFADLASPSSEALPESLRLAVLILVRAWYDDPTADVPQSVSSLIAPYRRTFVL